MPKKRRGKKDWTLFQDFDPDTIRWCLWIIEGQAKSDSDNARIEGRTFAGTITMDIEGPGAAAAAALLHRGGYDSLMAVADQIRSMSGVTK